MSTIPNARNTQDALLEKKVAVPAAGGNAVTASIDLEGENLTALDSVEAEIFADAMPSLAAGQSVTAKIEASPDNVTFKPIDQLAPAVITGGTGVGAGAFSQRYRFPFKTARFIRASIAVSATAGNNTAASIGFRLLT